MAETFRDPGEPVAARVEDLLSRLTLREKIGQLNQRLLGWETWVRRDGAVVAAAALTDEAERWGGIGALYGVQRADAWSGRDWLDGADPAAAADVVAAVQERVLAASRLGIPALLVEEAAHGHQALGAQLLPVNLAAAAAWRPDLLEAAALHVGQELRARGVHLALVPGLDVLRDPRWGRTEECFGEDPLLASLHTRALVRGIQSGGQIGVVLKHFAGQGAAIGGRNSSGAPIGPRELAELHLAAARAGIEAGAFGVMAAYNDVDGVPCVANAALLTGLLREAWGFDGIVMADMFAVDRLLRSARSEAEAGALALRAGVDLSMCDASYAALEGAVATGLVTEDLVDRACRRVLAVKVRLGLLDAPAPAPSFPPPDPARELLAGTAVLLANRSLLPLTTVPGRIAVIGPNADDLPSLLGDYVPPLAPGVGTTVLAGVRALAGEGVRHEPGCGLSAPIEGGTVRAAAAAAAADLVVLVLGSTGVRGYDDDFQANGAGALGGAPPRATTGEGFDVAEVALPAAQLDLVDVVTATGTPVVAVIVSGRPLGVGRVAAACDALLYGWYPGPEGGRLIAELVLGRREPTGRLPVSLPGSSGVLPVAYNERLETTRRYVDADAAAEFPFGAGLGWTAWELGRATAPAGPLPVAEVAGTTVTARLWNTGPRRGSQVVQLYGRARLPGLVPRRAVLLGFTRVTLDPGTGADVAVRIERDAPPGLGLGAGFEPSGGGTLELWLSVTGAEEAASPARVVLTGT